MGFSLTVSEMIILTASIVLASAISSYMMYAGNLVVNDVSQNVNEQSREMHLKLKIVYATVEDGNFTIYVKNVGDLPISEFSTLDVYVGEYGRAKLYTYNSTPAPGSFTITLTGDGDDIWDPGETAKITAYPDTGIPSGVATFEVKVVPLRGIGDYCLFPPPPT